MKTNLDSLEGSDILVYTQLRMWTNNPEEAAVTALINF